MKVIADKLNVRSGPGTNFRVLFQLAEDDFAMVVEAHGDWVWVHNPYGSGWVAKRFLEPDYPGTPKGLLGIQSIFGMPGTPECYSGVVNLKEKLKYGWLPSSTMSFRCHAKMEKIFETVFDTIYDLGYWHMIRTFDGCFNDRPIKAGGKKSTHAWGISVDLNEATNKQGTKGDMPEALIEIFEKNGFTWGGRWSGKSIDPMHFQYATDY